MHDLNKYKIDKVYISITSMQNAQQSIEEAVREGKTHHICVSDFRSICYASLNPDYQEIMNTSFMNTPDGMPLIWLARLWGIKRAHRTMGPELFVNMIKNQESGLKHFLLGDTEEILAKINSIYCEGYKSLIVGTFSPPFINVEEFDYLSIAKMINDSGADIVWVSMTAPKQDYFAVNIKPLLHKKVIIGVGAAFRYAAGQYSIPNSFIQKIGLTGLFLRKKTWRQLKWYLKHILILLGFSIQIMRKRLASKRHFE